MGEKHATQEDLDQIWSWNNNLPASIDGCVHHLIAEIAEHHPTALAVHAWDGDFTYAELNALSSKLAQHHRAGCQSSIQRPHLF